MYKPCGIDDMPVCENWVVRSDVIFYTINEIEDDMFPIHEAHFQPKDPLSAHYIASPNETRIPL